MFLAILIRNTKMSPLNDEGLISLLNTTGGLLILHHYLDLLLR